MSVLDLPSSGKELHGITYAEGQFVAAGGAWQNSMVLTSPDGSTWKEEDVSSHQSLLYSVEFLNGQWVAAGEGVVLTSQDGKSWSKHSAQCPYPIDSVTASPSVFILSSGPDCFATSPDGKCPMNHEIGKN